MKLSLTSLLEVEHKLNEISFLDVRLGGPCAGFLYPNIFYKEYEPSFSGLIRNSLLNFREKFAPAKNISPYTLPTNAKYLIFNISSSTLKNLEFFTKIYDLFADYSCIIISKEKKPFLIGKNDIYLTNELLTRSQHEFWIFEYKKIQNKIREVLVYLKNKFDLPLSFLEELKFMITLQTKNIVFFFDLLKKNKPSAIITDHDRHGINSSLALTGNALNVPTFTFIHGSTFPADHYYPLLSKYMICWGEMHKTQFRELGIEDDRLIVCGNQKLYREVGPDTKEIKARFGISEREKVALLITNPIDIEERLQYVRDFCYSIYQVKQFKGVIRIHPSEEINDYKNISEEYPDIIFTDNYSLSFDESMTLADHIINHNSVFGFEALIKKKDVIVYAPDYISFPLGIGKELCEKAGCILLKDASGLVAHFKYLKDHEKKINTQAEEYIKSYIYAFGEDAAKNIYKEVINRIN